MNISARKHAVRLGVLLIFLTPAYTHASATSGTISHSQHFAWSNNSGWVNWDAIGSNVTVTDTAVGGYVWSANHGWINLSPAQSGVINDGEGNLSGFAWDSKAGWIGFTGVHIGTNGVFTGQTTSNSVFGIMTFDCTHCAVTTDWRPVSTRAAVASPIVSTGGGGGPIPTPTPLDPIIAQAKLADIQKDGTINILDFNAMMVNWGATQNLAAAGSAFNSADMNKDGIVDIFDFNTLMVYWGTTYQL